MIVPNESEIGAEVNRMGLDVWIGLIRDIMCTHKHRGTHMYSHSTPSVHTLEWGLFKRHYPGTMIIQLLRHTL